MSNEKENRDTSFIFIAAIIAAVTLFVVNFPRTSAVIAIGIFIALFLEDQQRQRNARHIEYAVSATSNTCSENELQFTIKNNHPTMSLQRIGFDLDGYKPGFSDAVLSGRAYTDQIVLRGRTLKTCLSLRDKDGDSRTKLFQLKWKSSISRISFQ